MGRSPDPGGTAERRAPDAVGVAGPPAFTAVPLVGRSAETAALAAALARAGSGLGQVVIVEGEPGIGKTRIVADLVDRTAAGEGWQISEAGAEELERRRPFGVLVDALALTGRPADPDRARVAEQLHAVPASFESAAGAQFRAVEAITELVERLCARSPLLLLLEDVHWADPATVTCLARIGRLAPTLPLLLIVTVRPLPRSAELTVLLDGLSDRGALRLPLRPLAGDDLPALAAAVLGAPPGPNLHGQLTRAGGNPLLVLVLLDLLTRTGAIETTAVAEVAEEVADPVPSLTILHRLSFLPPPTVELLSTASVLGASFTATDLRLLTGRSVAELTAPLRAALDARVLAERGDRLAFQHELIRDALYADLPLPLRAALHRDLARALAEAGYSPGRVCEHLVRGAAPGDAEAVAWLGRAAEEAGTRSPAVVVELLDQALALAAPDDPQRGRLAADRAVALMFAGRGAEGEQACREVLARRDDPEREGVLRWLLLRTMLIRGRAAEAVEQLAAADAMPAATPAQRAHYRAAGSFARLVLGRLDEALTLAEEASALVPDGDALALSESLHARAQVLFFRGRSVESADLATRAVRALEADPTPRGPQTATATAGLMLVVTDRVEEGRAMLRRGIALNEALGAPSGIALNQVALADALFLVGEWDDAASEIAATEALVGDGPAWPVMSLGILAVIAVHRGDLVAAGRHLAAAQAALAGGAGAMRAHRMVLGGALLAEASGREEAGLAALTAGWDRFAAADIGSAFPELGPELARRLVAAGDRGRAAEVASAVEGCAAVNPGVATLAGAARCCRGLVDADPDLLLAAAADYRAGARPLGLASACEYAADALARGGRDDEARALVAEARGIYVRLGALRAVARVTATQRSLGVRRSRRSARARAVSGWDALTATELTVVGLVAQRLSNPEIAERMYLSRRTVETHVSHALAKLGVRSRIELAAAAAERAG